MSGLSLSILRSRNFRLLLMARMSLTTAMQAQALIVGWQIYSLTKSPFLLGLVGLAEALPAILGALVAGHIVDMRGEPARDYRLAVGVLALNALLFLLLGGGIVPVPDETLVFVLFGLVFLSGLVRSFTIPASFLLISRIVSRARLGAATAWITSGWQIAAVCGPAVAGIIYGGYGARAAWALPFLMLVFAVAAASTLRARKPPKAERKRESSVRSIREGWSFIWHHPVLLHTMTLDMFAVLFGGAVAMLPAFAADILHVGSEGLGALRAAPALGAVVTALAFALRPMRRMSAQKMLVYTALFGLSMIGFGLSTNFALSMAFLFLSGVFDAINVVMRNTLKQVLTPDAMRGRVSSISSMFTISSNEIGAFESGVAAALIGLVPSVVAGGVGTLVVVAAVALRAPKFRKAVVDT